MKSLIVTKKNVRQTKIKYTKYQRNIYTTHETILEFLVTLDIDFVLYSQ